MHLNAVCLFFLLLSPYVLGSSNESETADDGRRCTKEHTISFVPMDFDGSNEEDPIDLLNVTTVAECARLCYNNDDCQYATLAFVEGFYLCRLGNEAAHITGTCVEADRKEQLVVEEDRVMKLACIKCEDERVGDALRAQVNEENPLLIDLSWDTAWNLSARAGARTVSPITGDGKTTYTRSSPCKRLYFKLDSNPPQTVTVDPASPPHIAPSNFRAVSQKQQDGLVEIALTWDNDVIPKPWNPSLTKPILTVQAIDTPSSDVPRVAVDNRQRSAKLTLPEEWGNEVANGDNIMLRITMDKIETECNKIISLQGVEGLFVNVNCNSVEDLTCAK